MDKIERVDAVLSGEKPDRPPLSLWYHFGVQHGSGEQFAHLTLEFFRHYDLDFLKVMNDYFYPCPAGIDTLSSAADLKRLGPLVIEETDWARQLSALDFIRRGLGGRAYFIDTVFDPWQSLRRGLAGENLKPLMDKEPEALLHALDVVADNLIAYCRKSIAAGAAGIFMSVAAAAETVSREEFITFVKPPAMKVFAAIADSGKMNTAHMHGEELFWEACLDFPVQVFSWWDRGPRGPSLEAMKGRTPACVMGGIDQTLVARASPAFLRRHVREGIRLGGDRGFLLANGCSIDTWVYPGSVRAIVEAARSAPQPTGFP
jgi:uroporphyrinogen decarboxylase